MDSQEVNTLIEHQNWGWILYPKIYSLLHHLVVEIVIDVVQNGTISGVYVTWLYMDRTKTCLFANQIPLI